MAGDIKSTSSFAKGIMYFVVIIFTILALYPIYWLIIQSFKTTQEYMMTSKLALPKLWYIMNYPWAWINGKFSILFLNSIFYTAVTTFCVIFLSFMAGFAFAKLPSKLTPLLHGSFIIGILLVLQSILVPLFIMIHTVNLYNTRLGVLIPYIGLGLPMSVYLATAYMKSIPGSILESARMDGAVYFKIFASIIMPMSAPVAATVAIISTTGTWNEFVMINILVSNDELKSLPIGINKFSGALASDFGKQFSALVIGLVPMVLFYLIFRKQITQGVSAGAVKG
jgi:raffinose/stachyose/melibiose transport system permease protein